MAPDIHLLPSPAWDDYELLDSGEGQKLERFGPYTFIRPEVQALWGRALPVSAWDAAHAIFEPSGEESGGHWKPRKKIAAKWEMSYPLGGGKRGGTRQDLKFSVMTTPGRHLGVFPECAAHWDWMAGILLDAQQRRASSGQAPRVLNLFGYTGLASLACAACGAQVTHVDASRKSVEWARENQALSGLADRPIRWLVEDALKYVEREARRGVRYDGIYLDPPKFGRGPRGEVWEVYRSLPGLLKACRAVLSESPLFVVLTVYAVKLPAVHLHSALAETLAGLTGNLECGELVTQEKSSNRLLSQAVYARWEGAAKDG
jgi:23S rRNA (cytosine1962-C5)-methyltransferase